MNSQDSMSPRVSSKSTNVGPEKYNVDETYVKDSKMAVMNMLEVRKEEINKPIKEICEKIQRNKSGMNQIKQFKTCR